MQSETVRKIFVISDIHLGGEVKSPDERGFRICTHESELISFIDGLTALREPAIELVINGDIVDFLAEETGEEENRWLPFHFPESNAIARFNVIVKRSALVFDALARYLAAPDHRLVILPGNHDIELNLPAVQRRLRDAVGAGGVADYEYICNGETYRVGDVLIEHGNRVDDMNFVDYERLRHLCGLLSRGMEVDDEFQFVPPVGSKLVTDVINPLKEAYSFIDLLKPEQEAVFPVLLALDPGLRSKLGQVAAALINGKLRRVKQYVTRLYDISAGDSGFEMHEDEVTSEEDALGDLLERTGLPRDFALDLSECGSVEPISALSTTRSILALLRSDPKGTWRDRTNNLLAALTSFQKSSHFDRTIESDAVYWKEAQNLAEGRGGVISHVVFGHTHLAKKVPLPTRQDGYYFNSGTWADLLELPVEVLNATNESMQSDALNTFMEDLLAQNFSKYSIFKPTFVQFDQDIRGRSIRAELCDYIPGDRGVV